MEGVNSIRGSWHCVSLWFGPCIDSLFEDFPWGFVDGILLEIALLNAKIMKVAIVWRSIVGDATLFASFSHRQNQTLLVECKTRDSET